MLGIKLNSKTARSKIDCILTGLQKRCKERLLTTPDIFDICGKVERHIGIPKKYLSGVSFHYSPNTKLPSAYKYRAFGTCFGAKHDGKTWIITYIDRYAINDGTEKTTEITLSDTAKQKALENMEKAIIKPEY